MPQKFDRRGVFRGNIVEHAVNETKNGLPQLVARLFATEYYDESGEFTGGEPGWVDFSEYQFEDVGYFVLFNADGPLLNHEQVQLATGWDGMSFASLAAMDLSKTQVLFRVEENTYQDKGGFKIDWIDAHDAPPIRGLKTLDADKLKSLDSKFGLKQKLTAAKAPPKPAAAPKAATPSKPGAGGTGSTGAPTATKPAAASKPASPKPVTSQKSAASSPPKKSKQTDESIETDGGETSTLPAECDKSAAWTYINEKKDSSIGDDDVANAWLKACDEIGGDRDEDTFTQAEWAAIRDAAALTLSILPV